MKKNPIETIVQQGPENGYMINPDFSDSAVASEVGNAMREYDGIHHAMANWQNFDDVLPGQSGRPEFNRGHYEHFRPSEAIPKKYSDIIKAIDNVYASLSIVRNVIDLMSDFACEGIEIVHPVESIQKFHKDWFDKVAGPDRSERFLSGLYRHGMVVCRHFNADVSYKGLKDQVTLSEKFLEKRKIKPNNIPIKYLFYNPAYFSHKNYHNLSEEPKYEVRIPKELPSDQGFSKDSLSFYDSVPIEVDAKRLSVSYYKKDDWSSKPLPLLYPIIKHALMINKLNLADSAALDGAISKVRIFRVGNLEKDNMIWPKAGAMETLNQVLRSNTGGGTLDLIWDPAIDIIESKTDIHEFLGQEKYTPHLSQVYEGLGIPSSFVGVGTGTTNNYISLKILMRRLMSGRAKLVDFWNKQLKEVQLAMGFNEPARLEFNHLDLADEESERQMLIQLLDRNVISEEKTRKVLGYDPRLEDKRIKREGRARKSGRKPEKASQFHNPEKEFTLHKTAMERGYFAPEHIGLTKEPGTEDVEAPHEARMSGDKRGEVGNKDNEAKQGPGGRPPGSKDQTKRKTRKFSPMIKASLDIWALEAQNKISDTLRSSILETFGCDNFRQIHVNDFDTIELFKLGVLSNIDPMTQVTDEIIDSVLGAKVDPEIIKEYKTQKAEIEKLTSSKLSLEAQRALQRSVYIEHYENLR